MSSPLGTSLRSRNRANSLGNPTLIIGASHTGKSEMAIERLDRDKTTLVFGTAITEEPELKARIDELKALRPTHWLHIESCESLTEKIKEHIEHSEQVLLDSVNQWVASFILEKNTIMTPEQIEEALDLELKEIEDLVRKYQQKKRIIFVTSEVGAGISPPAPLARLFRRLVSRANCKIADSCDSVLLMTAGIPLVIKG